MLYLKGNFHWFCRITFDHAINNVNASLCRKPFSNWRSRRGVAIPENWHKKFNHLKDGFFFAKFCHLITKNSQYICCINRENRGKFACVLSHIKTPSRLWFPLCLLTNYQWFFETHEFHLVVVLPSQSICSYWQFRCNNGQGCIDQYYVCNGYEECSDGSDEWYWNCSMY